MSCPSSRRRSRSSRSGAGRDRGASSAAGSAPAARTGIATTAGASGGATRFPASPAGAGAAGRQGLGPQAGGHFPKPGRQVSGEGTVAGPRLGRLEPGKLLPALDQAQVGRGPGDRRQLVEKGEVVHPHARGPGPGAVECVVVVERPGDARGHVLIRDLRAGLDEGHIRGGDARSLGEVGSRETQLGSPTPHPGGKVRKPLFLALDNHFTHE